MYIFLFESCFFFKDRLKFLSRLYFAFVQDVLMRLLREAHLFFTLSQTFDSMKNMYFTWNFCFIWFSSLAYQNVHCSVIGKVQE